MTGSSITSATPTAALSAARPGVCHLTEKQQQEIAAKLALVTAIDDLRNLGSNTEKAIQAVALGTRRARSGLWVLWNTWDKNGRKALALLRPPSKYRDKHLACDGRPKLKKFILAMSGQNYSYVTREVRRYWGTQLLPYDGEPPSYNTVRSVIRKYLPESVRDAALLPKDKWNAKYGPYLVTGRGEYTPANRIWVGDHRLLDILVQDDRLWAEKPLAAIRFWLTCFEDMRTRCCVATSISVQPNSNVLAKTLYQGISRFGKPEVFYCDNGKDFKKFAAKTLPLFGIEAQFCTGRHPEAKPVESTFSFLSQFDHLFFGHGYTGSKPELRSELCRQQERQHSEYLSGKRQKSPLHPLSYVSQLLQRWVREYNEEHHHSGRGMEERTPLEVMDELLPPAQRNIPNNMAELEPLFWDAEIRRVRRCKVEVGTFTYSAALDDLEGQEAMFRAQDSGIEVAVRCDPNDMAFAEVFENRASGQLLARVVCDELAAHRPHTQEEITAIFQQRARLYSASRKAMDGYAAEFPTPIELLAQRGGIEPPAALPPRRIVAAPVPECAEDFVERLRKAR